MKPSLDSIKVLYSDWSEYELLDSGDYKKLERFGKRVVVRSEPKAWWHPEQPDRAWQQAQAVCDSEGKWHYKKGLSAEWLLHYDDLTLQARITEMSKHVGVFPEQSPHWEWIKEQSKVTSRRPLRLLSLFGYTGVASLIAASAGFTVTHLDASKPAINWAKQNQEISGMQAAPIRWILDDTVKFVNREIRRGSRYDAIIMDPPAFGRGPKQEVWKVEKQLVPLLDSCRQILCDDPIFVIITMYAIEASPLMIGNLLADMMKYQGNIELGELAIKPERGKRILPMSIFGRWSKTI